MGESKFYSDAKRGIDALLEDLVEHFKHDYLNEQFVIIKKNLENNSIPQREEWIERLTACTRLRDQLSMINIPMLCMYPHDVYKKFTNMSDAAATTYHETNIRELIGQINFYLEALDRDVKKPNENPSVGVILCASKDDAVVEYALSRSMSPTLVADYRLCLPDKTLLQNKLRELTELALESGESDEGDEE